MKVAKTISVIILSAAGSFCFAEDSIVAQKPETPPAPVKGPLPEEAKAMILERFDKDGDGFLNEEELAAAKKEIEERRERFIQRQRELAAEIIREYDKDGDGKLTEDELFPFLVKQHQMFAELRQLLPPDMRVKMRREYEVRTGRPARPENPPRPRHDGERMHQGPRGQGGNPQGETPKRHRSVINPEDLDQFAKPKSEE